MAAIVIDVKVVTFRSNEWSEHIPSQYPHQGISDTGHCWFM